MFSQRVCMETHTHQRVSVHASALFRSSRFGCVDCQERTDPLATYGRTSSIATSFRGNTVRRTRTVVLAWLFRRHAITKPTCHASISLSLCEEKQYQRCGYRPYILYSLVTVPLHTDTL